MQWEKASSYAYKNKKTCQLATNTTMKDKFTGQYTFTQLCNVSFYVNTLGGSFRCNASFKTVHCSKNKETLNQIKFYWEQKSC